jgi:nicotinate-nucleotide adenylyltransferase
VPEGTGDRSRIGVFGSAFNPPHTGHLILAGEALWRLGLERLVVVPTGEPWHKRSESDPGPRIRLALATAAFEGIDRVSVSTSEVERDGPSYTYETLEEIVGQNPESEIHLLMGADTATGFGGWRRPERVLELAGVTVVSRAGFSRNEVEAAFLQVESGGGPAFMEMPEIGISSSMVRQRIRSGEPFRHLVPAAVAEMIEDERLYGAEQ